MGSSCRLCLFGLDILCASGHILDNLFLVLNNEDGDSRYLMGKTHGYTLVGYTQLFASSDIFAGEDDKTVFGQRQTRC